MRTSLALILWVLFSAGLYAQKIPDVKVEDAAGKAVGTLSMVDGKTPFVLTFWASWCKPCMRELAALEEVAPDWNGKYPLRIYAVSIDDSRSLSRAKAVAAASDWPVTVLFDTKQHLKQAFSISSIPQVFVFDKDGKRVYSHMGFIPGDEDNLIKVLTETK